MENEKAGIHQVLTSWLQGERKIREKVVQFELEIHSMVKAEPWNVNKI